MIIAIEQSDLTLSVTTMLLLEVREILRTTRRESLIRCTMQQEGRKGLTSDVSNAVGFCSLTGNRSAGYNSVVAAAYGEHRCAAKAPSDEYKAIDAVTLAQIVHAG